MAVDPIGSAGSGGSAAAPIRTEPGGGERFAGTLIGLLRDVNADQLDAAREMKRLLVDGEGTIHEAMSAINKAEGSFRLLMEMRNRLVDGVNRLLTTQF